MLGLCKDCQECSLVSRIRRRRAAKSQPDQASYLTLAESQLMPWSRLEAQLVVTQPKSPNLKAFRPIQSPDI